jgi:hypothetical protein
MTNKEVMQMALYALESVYGKGKKCDAAIETLRAALAQPEKTDMQIGLTYEEANLLAQVLEEKNATT